MPASQNHRSGASTFALAAFLTSIGGFGAAPVPLFGPRAIAVDNSDRVHVITAGSPSNLVTTFAPVTAGVGTGSAKVVKPKGALKLQGKRIRVTVKCAKGAACTGTATVTVKGKAVTKPKAYSVKAGKQRTITLKATKPGHKVLRKKAVTKAVVTIHGASRKVRIRR